MRYGHGTCAILQHSLNRLKFSTLEYGKVLFQKPQLKSMAYGVYQRIVQCISAVHDNNSRRTEFSVCFTQLPRSQDLLSYIALKHTLYSLTMQLTPTVTELS